MRRPPEHPRGETLLPPAEARPPEWTVYVDLDAYYVSCELRDRPDLRGTMVIVGPPPAAGPTRGVVLSASYDARALGVRSAMPVAQAARLAPHATWLPPDFPKYERLAGEVRLLLRRFSPHVDPFSIDEAAVRLGPTTAERAREVATAIQRALRDELDLPASIGAATSRVVAKIATDVAKPGGIRVVPPEEVAAFLAPLSVRAIPGVGPKTGARLADAGWTTIGELAHAREPELARVVGGFARELTRLARGQPRESADEAAGHPRARSSDHTFAADATSWEALGPSLDRMAEELGVALERDGWRYGGVGVAYRWSDFSRSSRSQALPALMEGPGALRKAARRLGRELWQRRPAEGPRGVRTVSVRAERLARREQRQASLADYDPPAPSVK